MKTNKILKNAMKDIKKGLKHHRRLQKEVFCAKKLKLAKGKLLLGASRKKLHALFDREEALENHLLHAVKKGKTSPEKGNRGKSNGVSHARHDAHTD